MPLVVVHVRPTGKVTAGPDWRETARLVGVWSSVHPEVDVSTVEGPGDVPGGVRHLATGASLVVVGHHRRPWVPWFLDRSTGQRLLPGLRVPLTIVDDTPT